MRLFGDDSEGQITMFAVFIHDGDEDATFYENEGRRDRASRSHSL
jgi:hypothetical protein